MYDEFPRYPRGVHGSQVCELAYPASSKQLILRRAPQVGRRGY